MLTPMTPGYAYSPFGRHSQGIFGCHSQGTDDLHNFGHSLQKLHRHPSLRRQLQGRKKVIRLNRDAGTISRHHPSSFTSVSRKSSCRRGQLGSSSSQTKKALGICTSAQIPEAQANFFGKKKIPSQTSSPSFCLQGCRLSFPAIEDAPNSQKSHEEDDLSNRSVLVKTWFSPRFHQHSW